MRRFGVLAVVLLSALGMLVAANEELHAAERADVAQAITKASAFLTEQGQEPSGGFSPQVGPAVTALALTALVESGTPPNHPAVAKGLTYLLSHRQPNGGICRPDSAVANYETSIALMALVACNADGSHDATIAAARRFISGLQWDEDEGAEAADPAYGGAGYGSHKRPDLSNTAFLIEALKSAGAGADDPAIQRALIFVSRTQNLEGPNNTLPFAAKNPDGGFYYTPANGGESQAGETPTGGLRSYGSMTYAGLKSMIYAGVAKDDPRVVAATDWLKQHYTFAENPGLGNAGRYYYLHTAAKALDALGQETFTDADGKEHRWRDELAAAIITGQQPDGSWVNDNPRWLEGDANLVTSYALLALSLCR